MKTVYTDATFKAFNSIYHVLNGKRNVSMKFITLCLIIKTKALWLLCRVAYKHNIYTNMYLLRGQLDH